MIVVGKCITGVKQENSGTKINSVLSNYVLVVEYQ